MRKKIAAAILVGALLFGCKVSLDIATWFYPGYTQATKVRRDEIVGLWINRKDELRVEIGKPNKSGEYEFVFMESSGISTFTGVLFELKGQLLVDLLPTVKEQERMSSLFLIPTHVFAKVDIQEDSIKLSFLDFFWLYKRLRSTPKKIDFAREEGRILITEPTMKVQAMLKEFLDNPDAFNVTTVLESLKEKGAQEKEPSK